MISPAPSCFFWGVVASLAQGSLLEGSRYYVGCRRSNPALPPARQLPSPLDCPAQFSSWVSGQRPKIVQTLPSWFHSPRCTPKLAHEPLTLTLSALLLNRPIRRMVVRIGSEESSSILWVHMGGKDWRCKGTSGVGQGEDRGDPLLQEGAMLTRGTPYGMWTHRTKSVPRGGDSFLCICSWEIGVHLERSGVVALGSVLGGVWLL